MLAHRSFATAALIAFAIGAGCTINETQPPSGAGGNDGTNAIAPSHAMAMVTGQVDGQLPNGVGVNVNSSSRDVPIAPDNSFVVRDVPTGDVTLTFTSGSLKGTLTIQGVQAGEIIQIGVRIEEGALVIVIKSRTKASEPPREVDGQNGSALEITASHVCYWFKSGHYKRDIIVTGSDVHLFGAAHDSCVVDDLTFLDGKLEIRGDDVTVFDVEIAGDLVIEGRNDRVQDTCTKCFNDGCKHGCGDDAHGACDGGSNVDAGAPGDSDAACDSGMMNDAGSTNDAGVTYDAGSDGGVSSDAATGG
jgi:hypothetical protein